MNDTQTRRALWVAYGRQGVTGSILKTDAGYTVTMAGADEAAGTYPTMEIAKRALHARMTPGSEWPAFREH